MDPQPQQPQYHAYQQQANGPAAFATANVPPTFTAPAETIGDVLAVMQKLAKGGMNMVVVTHEMGFARSVADRIIFMAEGQVLVDTTDVDGFFDNPTEPRAVQFLSKIIDHNSDNVQVDA